MYSLDVAVADTYYVGEGQWLVHNCELFDKTLPNGARVLAEVRDGVLWTVIDTPKELQGQGFGKQLLNEAFEKFGDEVTAMGGRWKYGTNLEKFNELTAGGMSPTEAAKLTFTGKRAAERGFTNVIVNILEGKPGQYSRVEVIFGR